jgi:predicted O-methyltransferase YrrM
MSVITMRDSANTQGLIDLIEEFPNNTVMAEIGCFAGESTLIFYQSGKIEKLYAIDPWENNWRDTPDVSKCDMKLVEKLFDERINNTDIVKLKMTMDEAVQLLPELDVIYIDGNHDYDYVLNDIELSLTKIKNGGIICGHDYHKNEIGVLNAVNKMFGNPEKIFSDSSWMVRIINK